MHIANEDNMLYTTFVVLQAKQSFHQISVHTEEILVKVNYKHIMTSNYTFTSDDILDSQKTPKATTGYTLMHITVSTSTLPRILQICQVLEKE